ncbi:hypothetical protein [Rhodococcus erythropolis]|uniref:hypothetical protein n=2 Tax=Rhodococcus TaxID=1827 RepID=UPI0022B3BB71|nr:hypothetical protein [Rhodococcus erythropolis]
MESSESTWWMHRPGTEFKEAVWLDGWDDQSLWGWELGNYFLSLLPNGATDEMHPHFFGQPFSHISAVVAAVARVSRADPLSVCKALEILPSPGPVPSDADIISIQESARQLGGGDYVAGQVAACDWLLGRTASCPGSGLNWYVGQRPDRSIITAESEINTGEIFLDPAHPREGYRRGVDEVLGRIVARFR